MGLWLSLYWKDKADAIRRIITWLVLLSLVAITLFLSSSSLLANPQSFATVSMRERDGTLHPAPGYRRHEIAPEYWANPPLRRQGDSYAPDEVIIQFRSGVSVEQQNALMSAYDMRLGRPIYGESAVVAKVPVGRAMAVAQALRDHPLLELVGVNPSMRFAYDPNDPLAPSQQHLTKVKARDSWDYGRGLGAISLIAILDSGIDAGGNDGVIHPDFASKFLPENWVSVVDNDPYSGNFHGTHVGGIVTGGTDNALGIAATGFSAWPMSIKMVTSGGSDAVVDLDKVATAINWAADHGASVINMSFGCSRASVECGPGNPSIQLIKQAVDRAYARGITLVAAAHNAGATIPYYPAAFG
jgi:thermitase